MREVRSGKWLLMIYDNGVALWHGQDAEFTSYIAFLEAVFVLAVLSVLLLGVSKLKRVPPLNLPHSLGIVTIAGGASMWLGTSTASRFSTVCLTLSLLGFLMGAGTFGFCFALFRRFWPAKAANQSLQPTCRGSAPPSG